MATTYCMSRAQMSVVIFSFLLLTLCNAQNSPQDYRDAHNAARQQVGIGPMTWDDSVAAYAGEYAAERAAGDCQMVHSHGPYGENLFLGYGKEYNAVDAVSLWVEEGKDYDRTSNACAAGKQCGHYTQVMWSDSVRLGCARVVCNNGDNFITCNYDPPGNVDGQRPY